MLLPRVARYGADAADGAGAADGFSGANGADGADAGGGADGAESSSGSRLLSPPTAGSSQGPTSMEDPLPAPLPSESFAEHGGVVNARWVVGGGRSTMTELRDITTAPAQGFADLANLMLHESKRSMKFARNPNRCRNIYIYISQRLRYL